MAGMSGGCLGYHLEHVWGMSAASSGACLGHHPGHVWSIIWGMSGHHLGHLGMSLACLGQAKISEVLHASLMPFFNLISLFSTLTISPPLLNFAAGARCAGGLPHSEHESGDLMLCCKQLHSPLWSCISWKRSEVLPQKLSASPNST